MLNQTFYNQNTLLIAKKLLGNLLVYNSPQGLISGKIIETEAYVGPKDKASHASKGKTPRTELMFGPAGYWYIYLIYGMYNCLNIVTDKNHYPAAVLIRAVEPIDGIKIMEKNRKTTKLTNLCSGPGKLCQAYGIDKKLNQSKAFSKTKLYIKQSKKTIKPSQIIKAKRVGVDYAQNYKDKLWRFYIKDSQFISQK